MALIISLVLVLCGWYYLMKQSKADINTITRTVFVPETDLKKIELPPTEPPPPQKKLPPVATITNDPPRIVPDNQVTDTSTHTMADLDNKAISDVTSGGPAATGDNQAAAKPDTTAAVTAPATEPAAPAIFENPETMPEFPGGMAALLRFLGKNLQVPEDAPGAGQKVRVPVKFVVNKDGILSGVEFLAQTDNVFRKEILRVMAKMPKWKPGLQHGRTVAVYYTIPVIFDMSEN